jgi:hypothetical protein
LQKTLKILEVNLHLYEFWKSVEFWKIF